MRIEPPSPIIPLRKARGGDPVSAPATASPPTVELSSEQAGKLSRDLAAAISGSVHFDSGARALYATDAANYRMVPIGVVLPRTLDDVAAALEVARAHDVPVLARGGGTSLAGQGCNYAIVLDFSRHLHDLIAIDEERGTARVQPGLIVDHLTNAAQAHGLTYGPDPATHTHCTLGGMIGNNSCGVHSVMSEFYGPGPRTSDHVEELEILTYEGVRMRVGQTSESELDSIIAAGGPRGDIYRKLRDLRDRYAPLIRERFPDIPRRVSGYNLDELLPERGFHVARALAGTENTCITMLEATIKLMPSRPERVLVLLGYEDVYSAGDHIPRIREFRPVGCEGMDSRLVDFMRKSHLYVEDLELLPEGEGWLLVEFGADSQDEAETHARQMMAAIEREVRSMCLYKDKAKMHKLWTIRESGLGATAFVPGKPDTWPGWEDSAVPPDQIGPYLRDLRALFARYGYECSLYGHFAQGCVHTRIDFDLGSEEGVARYRRFTDDAADLCLRYGGSLSGEHGDGQARGDLLVKMYGPELIEAFHEFKAIWDPRNRMNPGKVLGNRPRTQELRLAGYRPPEVATHFAFPDDDGRFSRAAMRCVGVGECRKFESGTMCPSFMVTEDEKHSTRGRARLLFEMLQGELIKDGWQSEEVKDALDLCLACKGCKDECPVHVDMATYKAEFLSHYYEQRRRPRHAYAFGWIHRWARLFGVMPRLANAVSHAPGIGWLAKRVAGMATEREIPRFGRRPFKRAFARRERRARVDSGGRERRVLLWPDTFNNYFFPDVLMAAVEVLEHAGYHVIVPEQHLCCGRALYDYGMLDTAKALWERTLDALGEHIRDGTPMVGIEPSCTVAFRDELPNLFPADERARRLCEQTHTLGEFLMEVADGYQVPHLQGHALVHGHCHHKAIMGMDPEIELLSRTGLDSDLLDSGCCGMAGAFGFEAEHYEVSMAAGERVLLPAVRNADERTLIIADGFSCREQIRQTTGRRALHLAEALRVALRAESDHG